MMRRNGLFYVALIIVILNGFPLGYIGKKVLFRPDEDIFYYEDHLVFAIEDGWSLRRIKTLLYLLCSKTSLSILRVPIELQPLESYDTYLSLAVRENRLDVVRLLLSYDTDPNPDHEYLADLPPDHRKKFIPLCIAEKNKNEEMARFLKQYGNR